MTTRALPVIAAITLPILGACASAPQRDDTPTTTSSIIIDGDLSDWTPESAIIATPDELFLRFDSHDESQAIQAADFTTRIRIDSDNDITTGKRMITTTLASSVALSMGVEIQAELSPRRSDGTLRSGSAAALFTDDDTIETGHDALGFYALPTHNAPSFEARFDRTKLPALQHDGPILVAVDFIDAQGRIYKTQQLETTLPEFAPRPHDVSTLPEKSGTRVMSANILRSKPIADPEPFARLLSAIDPDIILYQEWFGTDESTYESWFAQHHDGDWNHAFSSEDHGVAVSTRYPILDSWTLKRSNTRAVFALVETPERPVLCVSVHLKCCGGAQSYEDVKRFQEAEEINAFITSIRAKNPDTAVVIAGDFNLVGTRRPLEVMGTALGLDDQDLTPAHTVTLGTNAAITWTEADSSFSPGRLDWLLYDTSAYEQGHSFALDTELLSPELLEESGLHPLDSRASDHLPLVIDLTPRPGT